MLLSEIASKRKDALHDVDFQERGHDSSFAREESFKQEGPSSTHRAAV
jgi:hypothetical protein